MQNCHIDSLVKVTFPKEKKKLIVDFKKHTQRIIHKIVVYFFLVKVSLHIYLPKFDCFKVLWGLRGLFILIIFSLGHIRKREIYLK